MQIVKRFTTFARMHEKTTPQKYFCGVVQDKWNYFAALAALMASISSGVTLNRSPQMP